MTSEHKDFCLRRLVYWTTEAERCYRLALMQEVDSKAERDYETLAERASAYVGDYQQELGMGEAIATRGGMFDTRTL